MPELSLVQASGISDDDNLVAKAKRGDSKAFNELLLKHSDLLKHKVGAFAKAPVPNSVLNAQAIKMVRLAADRYKPGSGASFRTFLDSNIRLTRFANSVKSVARIPEHRALMIRRFIAAKEALRAETDREPTVTELSRELGWSVNDVVSMEKAMSRKELAGSMMEFDQVSGIEDRFAETAEFMYFGLTPEEQLVWDYSLGKHGKRKIDDVISISKASGLSVDKIYLIKREIARRLSQSR